MRISAIVEIINNEPVMQKMAYLHADSAGRTFADGRRTDVYLSCAGTPLPQVKDAIVIVHPPEMKISEGLFVAVNGGESLMRIVECGEKPLLEVKNPGFIGVSCKIDAWIPIKAGVLTISDKGARGERTDQSGPILADLLSGIGSDIIIKDIVPDDKDTIAETLKKWSDGQSLDLVLTTGGTGLAHRDVTPEALISISDKIVPGIGEIMRLHSSAYTPRSFLTRGIAVTRNKTLIIAFPGSKKAVRECFEAIVPSIRHGVEILCGWDSECGEHHHHN